MVGEDKFHVLLFPENTFKGFTKNELADTAKTTEVLISLGAENREQVDEMARKAFEAGGTVYGAPGETDGWMYGCGFGLRVSDRLGNAYFRERSHPETQLSIEKNL